MKRLLRRTVLAVLVFAAGPEMSWAQATEAVEDLRERMAVHVQGCTEMAEVRGTHLEEQRAHMKAIREAATPAAREAAEAAWEAWKQSLIPVGKANRERLRELIDDTQARLRSSMRDALASGAKLDELMEQTRDFVNWDAWPTSVGYEKHDRNFRYPRAFTGPAVRLSYQRHTTAEGKDVYLFQPQLRSSTDLPEKLGLFTVVKDKGVFSLAPLGRLGDGGMPYTSH